MTLIYLSCAFVAGIFLGAKTALPPLIILSALLPFCFLPLFPNCKKGLLLTGLCLFALFGGALHPQSSPPAVDEHCLHFYNDCGVVEIQGMVSTEPEIKEVTASLQLSATEITIDGDKREVSGTALIKAPRYPGCHYGDVLKVIGKLETPQQFDDFDYKSYLERREIYSTIYYPKIEIMDRGKGFKPMEWIYYLRDRLSQSLSIALPEPQASLAQAILLGIRGGIPSSLREAFSQTGTAHMLAISGLHVSIILGMLLSFGIFLFGKQHSTYIWLAFTTIWLYALVTGMRPPVVRATVMGSLFLAATCLGRQRSALTALAFAAAVMVGFQPRILWDVSFQLSFLAMTGLVLLFPYFQSWGRKAISASFTNTGTAASLCNIVNDSFAVTLSAILATWPVIAYNFGIVSLVGLPATFLALLALPGIIVTAALVGGLGLFTPALAQIAGWLAWLFLSYLILIVQGFDALPFSSLQVAELYSWQIWSYYALLAAIMVSINYKRKLADLWAKVSSRMSQLASNISKLAAHLPKKWVITPLLIVTVLVWAAVFSLPDERLHVSFLNIGQGDAILIQTPCQQNILIDGGPSPQAINLELGKKLPFWDRTIDLVVLTQPQADHVTGLVEVAQRYEVKQVLEPGIPYTSSIYQQWLELVKEKNIKRTIAQSGQQIDLGGGSKIEVLNPPSPLLEGTSDDIDNNGVVLRLSFGEVSFLFTADIRSEAEWQLVTQRAQLRSTVLKVAHHGSQTSTSAEFLAVVDPEVTVISVGANNRFGHPSSEVVERLEERLGRAKVYLTSENGTIEFVTDGERLWVKTQKPQP